MPRKEKLGVREADICRRLRRFREVTKIPRTVFSAEAGIVGTRLLNCELGLTPVSYGVFKAVNARFLLNPEWLVYDRGPLKSPAPFDEKEASGKINPRDLLSEVCDKFFKERFENERKESHRFASNGNSFIGDLQALAQSLQQSPNFWEGVSEQDREKAVHIVGEIFRRVFAGRNWEDLLEEIRRLVPPERWPISGPTGL